MADSEYREQDAEGADDQIISMVDVLNDEQQLQDDANAVLGPCDDNICTYSQVALTLHCYKQSSISTSIHNNGQLAVNFLCYVT